MLIDFGDGLDIIVGSMSDQGAINYAKYYVMDCLMPMFDYLKKVLAPKCNKIEYPQNVQNEKIAWRSHGPAALQLLGVPNLGKPNDQEPEVGTEANEEKYDA